MNRSVAIVGAGVVSLAAACGGSAKSGPPPATARAWQTGAIVVGARGEARPAPYAAAGTTFDVRLTHGVDTRTSRPGDPISATVVQPVVASDGSVLVPAGTTLRGKIAAVGHDPGPSLDFDFESMALPGGVVPVGVRVVSAQQSRYQATPAPSGVGNMQPGSGATSAASQPTTQISMASGAVVRLALTRPIVSIKR